MTAVICGIIALVLLFADQITKLIAETANVNMTFIPGFINFKFYKNTGMAFSMFDDNPVAMTVITILTVLMIAGIAVLFFTLFKKNTPARAALAVIEAGAVGNLIDRLVLEYVRDFVDVSSIGFGVCNLADFYITFGAVALVIIILFVGKDAVIPLGRNAKKAEKRSEGHE